MLLPQYLINGWSNLDESYREYSMASTDDLMGVEGAGLFP